jgi:hypothetical protein
MDLYEGIVKFLRADVCPVYTPNDVLRDELALQWALSIPAAMLLPNKQTQLRKPKQKQTYSFEEAKQQLLVDEHLWTKLCSAADVPCLALTRSGKPRLDAAALRRHVLAPASVVRLTEEPEATS